jgi:hypothetical protein
MFAVLGILLIVAGAVITFAVDRQAEGVDLEALGWILMAGGALSLLISAVIGASWMSTRSQRVHTERHVSPDGAHLVEETHVA